jgi:hypothetical protein
MDKYGLFIKRGGCNHTVATAYYEVFIRAAKI